MASTSYQDIAVRLSVVEDKIDMIMRSFSIKKRYQSPLVLGQVVEEVKSLYDLYREIKTSGHLILPPDQASRPSKGTNGEATDVVVLETDDPPTAGAD